MGTGLRKAALVEVLDLGGGKEIVSVVGGGGKTALMFRLARELPGRTLLTTTTRIFTAQIERAPEWCACDAPQLASALDRGVSGLLVIGEVEGEKAFGVDPDQPARWLEHPAVDRVIVEADGSRMRPVKAPAEHEPVIAHGTTHVVAVAGIDALEAPVAEVAHRPERVSALTGVSPRDRLAPESLARLLCHEQGGMKGADVGVRRTVLLNKVESRERWERARQVARAIALVGGVDAVVLGALEAGDGWELGREMEVLEVARPLG